MVTRLTHRRVVRLHFGFAWGRAAEGGGGVDTGGFVRVFIEKYFTTPTGVSPDTRMDYASTGFTRSIFRWIAPLPKEDAEILLELWLGRLALHRYRFFGVP